MTESQSRSEQEAALDAANFATLTLGHICQAVCLNFGLTRDQLMSNSHTRRIARPRQVAMVLAREFTGRSYPGIGSYFAGRDHTTVLHAHRRVYGLAGRDPKFAAELDRLRRVLTAYRAHIAGQAA